MKNKNKTWHETDLEKRTLGDRIADWTATAMGSWTFIIVQTIIVIIWIIVNIVGFMRHWDAYPFILLNLLFSTQGAYAAPIIMMAQNRAADRDRAQARADYETDVRAKEEIEQLQNALSRIENEKLDKILAIIQKEREDRN